MHFTSDADICCIYSQKFKRNDLLKEIGFLLEGNVVIALMSLNACVCVCVFDWHSVLAHVW